MKKETAGDKLAAKVGALLRARNPIIILTTPEEARVEGVVASVAASLKYDVKIWDCAQGVTNLLGKEQAPGKQAKTPPSVLSAIQASKSREVWILRDFHPFWKAPVENRALRNLARELPDSPANESRSIVIITPSSEPPMEFADHVFVVRWKLPDREEMAAVLDAFIEGLADTVPDGKGKTKPHPGKATTPEAREAAIDAAMGLSKVHAQNVFSESVVTRKGEIDPKVIAEAKKQIINAGSGIEYYDPDPRGLDGIGGLDHVKEYVKTRRHAFSEKARTFGIDPPKGVLLVGVPGCLAEGTRISYLRGKRVSSAGRSLNIETLYEKFNGIVGRGQAHAAPPWLPGLSTRTQSWDQASGRLVYNEIESVIESGIKSCVRVSTNTTGEVTLTADHPVLMANGSFKNAGTLSKGDEILVRGSMKARGQQRKRVYAKRVIVEGLKYHPVAWLKVVVDRKTRKRYEYQRATRARLVMEAFMNKIPYDKFVRILKNDPERAETLVFLPAECDVHHADENPLNDDLGNLVVMFHEEHVRLHGDELVKNFSVDHTAVAKVVGVVNVGPRRTFDVTMAEPQTNLVVNSGIIVHNCGKSLTAKCIASAWSLPLLRLDMGAAKGGVVGESERKIRACFAIADAIGPCIVWLDEIEKALAGASGGALDSGVSTDALGALLTWMEEHKNGAFVIATSNDVSKLPPEVLRKGRFDDIFFVDLPTSVERREILRVAFAKVSRDMKTIDLDAVVRETHGFAGAEVASLVSSALLLAFEDGARPLRTADFLQTAKSVVPLAVTAAEKIKLLREWAKTRARRASLEEVVEATTGSRALDVGEDENDGIPGSN